jgi:hypothetical protein
MTRLFDTPNPYPGRVFRAALARGIQLWEETQDTPACSCGRRWNLLDRPQEIIILAALKVSLELSADPDTEVQLHAGGFLQSVLYSRDTLPDTVNDFLRGVAADYGSVKMHTDVFRHTSWFVLARPEAVEEDLASYRKDPVLSLFLERFDRAYAEVAASVGTDALKPLLVLKEIDEAYAKSEDPVST